ncbi:MAG: DUF115 domain-containing protein [Spirochaetaceae bacterium]|jgi:hypothetical protein|nr:DUF115 domain-containing protein [Spirochaetaceae bacterium]
MGNTQILPAKNGSSVLVEGETWLHSRYNPEAEAERYIASLEIPQDTTHFILIECASGYLIPVLKTKFPGAVILSLHCKRGPARPFQADFELGPETPHHIRKLLEKEIPENARLKIIEWRPSLAVYQKEYLALMETAAAFLRFHTMNKRTAVYFEKRWEQNIVNNLALFHRFVRPQNSAPPCCPVAVIAAGPGLAACLPELRQKQNNVFVIAVSSSLYALYEHGIKPDIVVATDGGFWALPHLYALRRHCNGQYPVIAAALNARIPSFLRDAPFLPVSDGSGTQNRRLSARHVPFITLPQRGTVSATALDLAFALTRGPVYLAGLDLGDKDVRSHTSPHAFETLFRAQSGRFAPLYHRLYARSRLNAESDTMAVYAAWFQNNLAQYLPRLVPLAGNHPLFGAAPSGTIAETGKKAALFRETAR